MFILPVIWRQYLQDFGKTNLTPREQCITTTLLPHGPWKRQNEILWGNLKPWIFHE